MADLADLADDPDPGRKDPDLVDDMRRLARLRDLHELTEVEFQRAKAMVVRGVPTGLVGQLEQLAQLHSSAAPGDAEYAAAKQQLLG